MVALALFVALVSGSAAQAEPQPEPALFRVFLLDGSSVVSYGELARVNDELILSLPVGGSPAQPRLHSISIAASLPKRTTSG
jgi:hypothetical protein